MSLFIFLVKFSERKLWSYLTFSFAYLELTLSKVWCFLKIGFPTQPPVLSSLFPSWKGNRNYQSTLNKECLSFKQHIHVWLRNEAAYYIIRYSEIITYSENVNQRIKSAKIIVRSYLFTSSSYCVNLVLSNFSFIF